MFDSHVHTSFSVDSEMHINEAIQKSASLDLGIIITDHMDFHDYKEDTFLFDADDFFSTYEPYRSDKLLLGIELGFRKEAVSRCEALVKDYNFDFILGSVHAPYATTDRYEYADAENYIGVTKTEAYYEYFQSMLQAIQSNTYFDSLAHIDYIARYSSYDNRELYYDEQRDGINMVLKELAHQEKSMEISTRRIANSESARELLKIYKQFKTLGGETVTFGSDSHYASTLGQNFDLAMDMANTCGLKPVYYKNRQQIYIK